MLTVRSFDSTIVSPHIETPRMEEMLLQFPFVKTASFDDLYKHGTSDLKNFLDQVPLQYKHKHITVNMEIQLLSPERTTAPRSNWHFDGLSFRPQDESNCHLFVSDCYARTEFLKDELDLPQFDTNSDLINVELFMNQNLDLIEPVKMPANRFVTFNELHFHRPVRADRTEFRFMIRVLESDFLAPVSYHAALMNSTTIFDDEVYDYSKIDQHYIIANESKKYVTLERYEMNKFTLNFM